MSFYSVYFIVAYPDDVSGINIQTCNNLIHRKGNCLLTKRIVSIEKRYLGSILENTTGYHALRSFEQTVRARKLQCWTERRSASGLCLQRGRSFWFL